jgi:hypothetical protein
MKRMNLIYWISTIIFAGLMLFTAIPDALVNSDSVKFTHDYLGYPIYFIPFLGIAKILGIVTILIPGISPRLKEWAYAGLAFDLTGAIYSNLYLAPNPQMVMMLLWVAPGIVSYIYFHKRLTYVGKSSLA